MSDYTPKKAYGTPGGFAADYIDVATRIADFRAKYPNGSLRPYNPSEPIKVITIEGKTYLQYVAVAYRSPEDIVPGIGVAWELFPGKTPFTRDSEAMVAETSAWGRAIVAALSADTKKGIASAEEVAAAKARQSKPAQSYTPSETPERFSGSPVQDQTVNNEALEGKQLQRIGILRSELGLTDEVFYDRIEKLYGVISSKDLTKTQANDLISKLTSAKKGSPSE